VRGGVGKVGLNGREYTTKQRGIRHLQTFLVDFFLGKHAKWVSGFIVTMVSANSGNYRRVMAEFDSVWFPVLSTLPVIPQHPGALKS
jgi:hypothetical protein